MDDLQKEIADIKASSRGRVPPLPEFTPVESFAYSANQLGDPFVTWEVKAAKAVEQQRKASQGGGLQPDFDRRREPLESFPLDALSMVGTLRREKESAALIKSPDGLVSRVVKGNYLGQNHGRVTAVHPDKIEITEIVPDGLGGWLPRQASLVIAE
jgi:type IV pilus assembly protein PilP